MAYFGHVITAFDEFDLHQKTVRDVLAADACEPALSDPTAAREGRNDRNLTA